MHDHNRKPRSDSELPSHCENCGAKLETDEWHPTESVSGDDGVQRLLVFCDEECLSSWEGQPNPRSVD